MSQTPPILEPGKVSLLRCDINTGHVLKINGALYLQKGEIFQVINYYELAERYIRLLLRRNPQMEFVVYNSEGQCKLKWNQIEKRSYN